MTPFLAYGRQQLDEEDFRAVVEVLRGDWLTGGPMAERFERAFAAAVGAPHAVACSSGTAALHLAALAAGLGPGDAAVVPAQTFAATANAVRLAGAEVVFADVDPETGLMGAEQLERALAGRHDVRAVLPVHLNGPCVDMAAVGEVAAAAGLTVIEDAAHALGSRLRGSDGALHPVGACRHGHMTIFSLHPVKTITMGEGGVVTTGDGDLAERLALLRGHGITRDPQRFRHRGLALDGGGEPNPWYYELQALGLNYRADDIHCALGLSQLRKLEGFVRRRAGLKGLYEQLLEGVGGVVPVIAESHCEPGWHLAPVLIDFEALGAERARLMRGLADAGIGTQVHYQPLHLHPYYRERYGERSLPGAEAYYRRVLSLPLHPGMEEGDVERVVGSLARLL